LKGTFWAFSNFWEFSATSFEIFRIISCEISFYPNYPIFSSRFTERTVDSDPSCPSTLRGRVWTANFLQLHE
jgi:hypothetical protein